MKNNISLKAVDSMDWPDFNSVRVLGDFPLTLIRFLDTSIEYLNCEIIDKNNKIEFVLKFHNKDKIILHYPQKLNRYLSSGTVKV